MEANELRIGNKVNYTVNGSHKHIGEITGINKTEDGVKAVIDYHYPLSFGEPIELSHEILEKCGFKQLPHFTVQNLCNISLGRNRVMSIASVGTPNEMVFINEEEPPVVKSVIVARNYDYDGKTYLHHIQNLYHYFTNGEELTVNL